MGRGTNEYLFDGWRESPQVSMYECLRFDNTPPVSPAVAINSRKIRENDKVYLKHLSDVYYNLSNIYLLSVIVLDEVVLCQEANNIQECMRTCRFCT